MAKGATSRVFDREAAFVCWYNNGQPRTYLETAELLEVPYTRVLRVACDFDWRGRADQLDLETSARVNTRLVTRMAQARIRLAETALAEIERFSWRLADDVRDESGAVIPNPYRLEPAQLSVMDFLRAVRVLEKVGIVGHGSHEIHVREPVQSLEALREEVAAMYEQEDEFRG